MTAAARIVIVNHVHPARQHVSALRMKRFAHVLAAAGERVLFLTEPFDGNDAAQTPGSLKDRIAAQDWEKPLHIACRPAPATVLHAARNGRLPTGLRQLVLGTACLFPGGVFSDWYRGAGVMFPAIVRDFRPDVVFGTFGNTGTWTIARSLARQAGCPWVGDFKDPWEAFVPAGFRSRIARQFADMAHMTCFSETHCASTDRWFENAKSVVYSGYDGEPAVVPRSDGPAGREICLSGSTYDDACLGLLFDGLRRLPDATERVVTYAGNDGEAVRKAASHRGFAGRIEILGYLDPPALRAARDRALANVYVRNPDSLFQQKLIELLAAGRPVMSIPGESAEASEIARQVNGTLLHCADAADVAEAVGSLEAGNAAPKLDPEAMERFSWNAQGEILRGILHRVVETGR